MLCFLPKKIYALLKKTHDLLVGDHYPTIWSTHAALSRIRSSTHWLQLLSIKCIIGTVKWKIISIACLHQYAIHAYTFMCLVLYYIRKRLL